MLTGAVLARTGFNRRAAYATLAMAIAAEFPDIDSVWSFAGPLTGFEHHRGITHTLVAIPFEAALITVACWAIFRLRARQSGPRGSGTREAGTPGASTRQASTSGISRSEARKAPPNWLLLFAGSLLGLASHILLDWTNNYGVRPFFPFNPHWYAGSFVFIFEPVLFLLLLAALVLPWLFGLINAEVAGRRHLYPSPAWAFSTLVLIAALYVFRFDQHALALRVAEANTPAATRVFASPHPINPWLWSTIAETPATLQLATIDTRTGMALPSTPSDTLYKAPTSLALLAAKRSTLGHIYLDWSMYPILSEAEDHADPAHPLTRVTFADARFLYDTLLMEGRAHPPLTGTVLLDMQAPEGERVVETKLGSREQH